MASNYKVLGRLAPAANTATTLYTVPANYSTVVSTLMVCNQTTTASTYRIAVRPGGAALDPKHYIAYDAAIPAQDTVGLTIGLTIAATDIITVYSANSSTSFNLFGSEVTTLPFTPTIDYLVVAGGGGGGRYYGGGGGGGGLLSGSTYSVLPLTTYIITVGAGGNGTAGSPGNGSPGNNSSITATSVSSILSIGGGYGAGNSFGVAGGSGGSGGGAGGAGSATAGAGTAGQGNAGGATTTFGGSGGGGSGAAGGNASSSPGPGGSGTYTTIISAVTAASIGIGQVSSGTVYFAGGGGGSQGFGTLTNGGVGGGGNGATDTVGSYASAGTPNTGGGGGGGSHPSTDINFAGKSGGSGVVIIRYPDTYTFASVTGSPTITNPAGYRVYTFTQSGTISF
jgi:hypothetical protein